MLVNSFKLGSGGLSRVLCCLTIRGQSRRGNYAAHFGHLSALPCLLASIHSPTTAIDQQATALQPCVSSYSLFSYSHYWHRHLRTNKWCSHPLKTAPESHSFRLPTPTSPHSRTSSRSSLLRQYSTRTPGKSSLASYLPTTTRGAPSLFRRTRL